ncbi:hypothetical protein CEP54_010218 [Fusarium duplospermum]|uniref:TRP C-terminal domain-containing protein n=1 Tax=Fusarium duplospermum TaxID=1325734 RepID=A0A428PL90_9HYPO|nr:hypothetical protein CEP54_010218 [Fusarium duplospermum]
MLSFRSILFALLLVLARPGLAAYVQFRDCTTVSEDALASHPRFTPHGFGASLDERRNETQLQLTIAGEYADLKSCEQYRQQDAVSMNLSLAALGGTNRYNGEVINSTCDATFWASRNIDRRIQYFEVLFRIDHPAPLAAFELELDIWGSDHRQVACLNAFLTPDIGLTMQRISFWGPVIAFALVILAAGWREWSNLVQPLQDDEEGSVQRPSNRSHLTRIADCLSYIQFIFFAGALSLNYPGFLQPIVSSTSWSTLMLQRGIVMRHSHYFGIRDGIHEINGTFGGTSGLEHMIQVMGAPVNMDTWGNIATLATVILICLFILIHVGLSLRWTRDWFRQAGQWSLESSARDNHKATMWVALRVFLSYLLLPLTAWATYQIDMARFLPSQYTILTVVVITLLVLGCWWGLSSRSPQNMGYLLIDELHRQEADEVPSRTQDYYTLATFGFLILRGSIIGGLQHFGTEQLFALMACEVGQLGLAIWAWSVSGLLSRATVVTCARLCILLLCVGMVPDLASHKASSALGYIILMFHALFMVGMFLVPSAYDLVQFAIAAANKKTSPEQPDKDEDQERPQVFGLRQLSRRPTTVTNLSVRGLIVDHERNSSLSSKAPSVCSPRASSFSSEPVSPELLRTYFRSPRPERSSSSLRNHQFKALPGRVTPESISESTSESSSDGGSGGDMGLEPGEVSPAWQMASPSNPNVDYSFREADLYYVKPRRVSFRQASPTSSDDSGRPASFVSKIRFWSR